MDQLDLSDITSQIDSGLFEQYITTQPIFTFDKVNLSSQLIDIFRVKYLVFSTKHAVAPWNVSLASQMEYNSSLPLTRVDNLSQSALAEKNISIDTIQLRMDAPSNDSIHVNFKLLVDKKKIIDMDEQLVRVGNYGWYGIHFPSQKIKKGQEVTFEISPIEKPKSARIYFVNFDIYNKGELLINQESSNSDATFYIFGDDEALKEKYKLVYEDDIKIYENLSLPESLPIVFEVQLVDKQSCASQIANVDLYSTALVTQTIDLAQNKPTDQQLENQAKFISYHNNRLQIQATLNKKGLVILSDTWFPGWNVKVDGVRQEIVQVNCIMRGVVVDEGSHVIEMYYLPDSIKIGSAISFITLIMLVMFLLRYKKNA